MSKYLIFQDAHIKGNNSINRVGDYFSDLLVKFDELLSIAKEHKVKAIIDNGDLLHSPEPSYKILDEIADRVEKTGIPFLSLYGNHCMLYRNIEGSKYTGLSHLFKRSQYFKYLIDCEFDDMELIAIDYAHNIEEDLKNKNLLDFKTDKYRVGLIHAFVSPKPFPYATHVLCEEVKNSGNCVLFIGHYHCQYHVEIGDVIFENIGCFGRNAISEAKIEPACILLDTKKRSYEIIKLKTAKKAAECFDLKSKQQGEEFEGNIEEFITQLKDISCQSTDLRSMVQQIGKSNNVEQDVVDVLINKVNEIEGSNGK